MQDNPNQRLYTGKPKANIIQDNQNQRFIQDNQNQKVYTG